MNFLFANRMNPFWEEEIRKLKLEFPDHTFDLLNTEEDRDSQIGKADGIIIGNFPLEALIHAHNLKILFVPWTGLDRLPFELLLKKNCLVANTHGNADAVAERAFGLCLSLLGKITEYDRDLRNGIWHGYSVNSPEKDKWVSLRKKSVGIIGYGVIGQKLAELLTPFNCKIQGFNKHFRKNHESRKVTLVYSLDEIIEKSDVLFLLLPLTHDTRNIINKEILQKMNGKYLINMGRGGLIVENDLFQSLQSNELKGFASDVWYRYPNQENQNSLPSKNPIEKMPNVIFSPHVGGFNLEGQNEMILETFENMKSYIRRGKPVHFVNLKDEY